MGVYYTTSWDSCQLPFVGLCMTSWFPSICLLYHSPIPLSIYLIYTVRRIDRRYISANSVPRGNSLTMTYLVKHVSRDMSSLSYFHVERYSLIYTAYQSDERYISDILTKVSGCGIINISRETKTSYTIRRTVIDRNPKMWYNKPPQ